MTYYTPTPEDLAAYQRLMLRHEGLRTACRFRRTWVGGKRSDDCPPHCGNCHGSQVEAPPPEWWLGLLVRVAGYAVMWWSPEEAGDSCWLAEVHGGAAYPGMFPESALLAALEAAAVP